MSTKKLVVCQQCGKKFNLKEGFSAASFQCTACGATVWVKEKSAPAPSTGRRTKARAGTRGGRARGGRAAAPAAAAGRGRSRGRRGREEPEPEEQGGRRGRGRYQKQSSNTAVMLAIGGLVVVIAIVAVVMMSGKDDATTNATNQAAAPGAGGTTAADATPPPAETPPAETPPAENATPETPAEGAEPAATAPDPAPEETPEPAKTLGSKTLGTKKKVAASGLKSSRWDPPADLGHLPDTPPEMRKKIDEWIGLLIDPQAGRDSLDAKEKLIAVGKPAFLPVLGAMAKIRDTITDVDSMDERLIESSLKLADGVLREMDGFLTSHGKTMLRPGSEKKYIAYICRWHYRRWLEVLKDLPEMPGPFDASRSYEADQEAPEEYK